MMDRIDETSMLSRLDRETIFHQTVLWTLDKIETQKPDFLISVENPHLAYSTYYLPRSL